MPAQSKAQQEVMVIAEHNPSALYARNRGVLNMSKKQLHDFANTKTKNLPNKKTQKSANKPKKRYSRI